MSECFGLADMPYHPCANCGDHIHWRPPALGLRIRCAKCGRFLKITESLRHG